MINNNQKRKGFTLVETLVSLFIFSIISILLINFFVSVLDIQKRILKNQELLNQSSYVLEYMAKAIRMAEKDLTGDCIGLSYAEQNYIVSGSSLIFLTYDPKDSSYKCLQFLLSSGVIEERRSPDRYSSNLGAAQSITSSSVSVDNLWFDVKGDLEGDEVQPKTTIVIKMTSLPSKINSPNIIVQTTISQRQLDI